MQADNTLSAINGILILGNTVVPLATTAITAIVDAIKSGKTSVDITVSLPSAESEFQRLVDVANQWDLEHPKT